MKRLFALLLVFLLFVPSAFAEQVAPLLDEAVEASIDHYIAKFGLNEECKDVIVNYLPDVNQFFFMAQDAQVSYAIIMNNGKEYFLTVMKDGSPMILQSGEKDYKLRTRYYDKFAK